MLRTQWWNSDDMYALVERLRRLELYGHDKHHPADEPHRHDANVLVFHLADVDTIDAS